MTEASEEHSALALGMTTVLYLLESTEEEIVNHISVIIGLTFQLVAV